MAVRLFEKAEHAVGYALYRPRYCTEIRDIIKTFVEKHKCSFETMADVACGSGQSIHHWTETFKKCVGVDISEEQIRNAREKFQSKGIENVKFCVAPAESLPADLGEKCDLLTIAQAWHWIDSDRFYKEADRVLRSPGVLAVYGYGIPYFQSVTKASEVILHYHNVTLKDYWHLNRRHIVNRYSEVKIPYSTTERHDIVQEWSVPLSHFVSYLGTWSAYWSYKEQHFGEDVLSHVHKELKSAFNLPGDDPVVTCSFPIFINMGLKE